MEWPFLEIWFTWIPRCADISIPLLLNRCCEFSCSCPFTLHLFSVLLTSVFVPAFLRHVPYYLCSTYNVRKYITMPSLPICFRRLCNLHSLSALVLTLHIKEANPNHFKGEGVDHLERYNDILSQDPSSYDECVPLFYISFHHADHLSATSFTTTAHLLHPLCITSIRWFHTLESGAASKRYFNGRFAALCVPFDLCKDVIFILAKTPFPETAINGCGPSASVSCPSPIAAAGIRRSCMTRLLMS